MPTPYSLKNRQFTDKMHEIARKEIYPVIFGAAEDEISFWAPDELEFMDFMLGIDKIARVKPKRRCGRTNFPVTYTIQERFREPKYAVYNDITVTLINTMTNEPGEFYKLSCGLFVYGYADSFINPTKIIDWIVVDAFRLREKIIHQEIKYSVEFNERLMQKFLCIKFDNLEKSCIVFGRKKKEEDDI